MTQDLVPLQPDQHPVTRLPKVTTELPFFYLTKQKSQLVKPITFETVDEQGKQIKWKVTPNTTLGAPGIEAHEIWVKLIKPAIDERRQSDGYLPAIIPLGKVRECLRILGWKSGGWEAARLFARIRQITGAICEADFYIPILGSREFAHIKADFSRMSLYAVGATHLSRREVKTGKQDFDFDIEDTVYIQLHSVEQEIQQNEKPRYVDNEYLFSVSPSARRWYELLAPKFYGVTANARKAKSSPYCEVRYSWYIERHHTLKRETERYKVAQQMNKIIKDHQQFGYVLKAEYYTAPDDQNDFIIRYYPGPEAATSAKRVLAHLNNRHKPKAIQLPLLFDFNDELPPVAATPKNETPGPKQEPNHSHEEAATIEKLTRLGIDESRAAQLVEADRAECELWADAWPYQNQKGMENPAAVLISFIEKKRRPLPKGYKDAKTREAQQKEQEQQQERAAAEESYVEYFLPKYRAWQREELQTVQKENLPCFSAFQKWFEKDYGRTLQYIESPTRREAFTLDKAETFFNGVRPDLGVRLTTFQEWNEQYNPEACDPLDWCAKNPHLLEELFKR